MTESDVIYRKRKRTPKYAVKKFEKNTKMLFGTSSRSIYEWKCITLNDESYFTFSHHKLSGNYGFHTDNIEATSDNVKYAIKSKFEQTLLVWAANSSKGVSVSLILPNQAKAINFDVYIGQSLPKLKPFVEKYHAHDKFML